MEGEKAICYVTGGIKIDTLYHISARS